MAADTDAILTNNVNGYQFLIRGLSIRPRKTQPVVPISLPTTTAGNTLLFPFFGQAEVAQLTFALFDDGTDCSNGTSGSAITTVNQQWQWLNEQVFGDSFSGGQFVTWNLQQTDVWSATIKGVIVDLELDAPGGKPTIRTAVMTFQRGKIGLS